MYRKFKEIVNFQMVYVKEAHPENEWWSAKNRLAGILFNQPKTNTERLELAHVFQQKFHLQMPLLVDPIENPAGQAFSAWPERIYIIDPSGKIIYKGGMGPDDFDVEEAREFLQAEYIKQFGGNKTTLR